MRALFPKEKVFKALSKDMDNTEDLWHTVPNSIVMQDTVVDDKAQLDYVILDKDVLIKDGRRLAGYLTYPVYVPKKSHI